MTTIYGRQESLRYFCRRSFATWDILLPTKEEAAKVVGSYIITKHFRLKLEYMRSRRIWVTVCNVPVTVTDIVLGSCFSANGKAKEVIPLRNNTGSAFGHYGIWILLNKIISDKSLTQFLTRIEKLWWLWGARCHTTEVVNRLAIRLNPALSKISKNQQKSPKYQQNPE